MIYNLLATFPALITGFPLYEFKTATSIAGGLAVKGAVIEDCCSS